MHSEDDNDDDDCHDDDDIGKHNDDAGAILCNLDQWRKWEIVAWTKDS